MQVAIENLCSTLSKIVGARLNLFERDERPPDFLLMHTCSKC